MPLGRLTALQSHVLAVLAGLEPPWTLTGGGALAATHTGHRTTRDIDLFFHGQRELGTSPKEAEGRLAAAGLEVDIIQRTAAFCRLRVTGLGETAVLDLVAEPVPTIEPPLAVVHGDVTIQVDTRHEVLVNKLCALLSRSEVRDLRDVEALLGSGGDLARALSDAPKKDGGFSALTLAWILETFALPALAARSGLTPPETAALERFRADLASRIALLAVPE